MAKNTKRLETIVPDLASANHPEGSVLQTPGLQMHEIKRIQSINRTTGISTELNGLYKARPRKALSSELQTAESKRFLKNIGPKPEQQIPDLWDPGTGESLVR